VDNASAVPERRQAGRFATADSHDHEAPEGEAKAKGEEKALAAVPARRGEAANRDNPKFKNRHKSMARKEIPKVNRDKNATSASPDLRPAFQTSSSIRRLDCGSR
jgi:hypothetical protein